MAESFHETYEHVIELANALRVRHLIPRSNSVSHNWMRLGETP